MRIHLFGKSVRTVCAFVFSMAFGFGGFVQAQPAVGVPAYQIKNESLVKMTLENLTSTDQVLLLGAIEGSSAETLRTMATDMNDKVGSSAFPKLKMVKNEVYADGKATGIKIDFNFPLRVSFHDQVWTYDKNIALDKNYVSLEKVLEGSKPARKGAALELFVPAAFAEGGKTRARVIGAAVGAGIAVTAGLIAGGTIATTFSPVILGLFGLVALSGMVTTLGGGMVGGMIHDQGAVKKALAEIRASSEIKVRCDSYASRLSLKTADGKTRVIEFMSGGATTSAYARVLEGSEGNEHVKAASSFKLEDPIFKKMISCKTDEEAARLTAELNQAVEKVVQAKTSAPANQKGTPEPGKSRGGST